jgi:hypothetical protein
MSPTQSKMGQQFLSDLNPRHDEISKEWLCAPSRPFNSKHGPKKEKTKWRVWISKRRRFPYVRNQEDYNVSGSSTETNEKLRIPTGADTDSFELVKSSSVRGRSCQRACLVVPAQCVRFGINRAKRETLLGWSGLASGGLCCILTTVVPGSSCISHYRSCLREKQSIRTWMVWALGRCHHLDDAQFLLASMHASGQSAPKTRKGRAQERVGRGRCGSTSQQSIVQVRATGGLL